MPLLDDIMMFTRLDLQFTHYRWRTDVPDDSLIRNHPANALLDVNEGNEVLDFINRFLETNGRAGAPLSVRDGHRVERLLQRMPTTVRTHARVSQWVKDNWSLAIGSLP